MLSVLLAASLSPELTAIFSIGAASSVLWWLLFRRGRLQVVPSPKAWPLDDGYRHTIEGTIVDVEQPVISPVTRQRCAGWVLYGPGGDDEVWRYSESHVVPVVLRMRNREIRLVCEGGKWNSHYRAGWTRGDEAFWVSANGTRPATLGIAMFRGSVKESSPEEGLVQEGSFMEGVIRQGDFVAVSGRFRRAKRAETDVYRGDISENTTRDEWIVSGGEVPDGEKRPLWARIASGRLLTDVFFTVNGRRGAYGFPGRLWWWDLFRTVCITVLFTLQVFICALFFR